MGNFVVDGTVLPGPKAEWDGVSIPAAHPEMFFPPAEYNVVRDAINDLRALMPVYHAGAYLFLDGIHDDSVALNALMQTIKPTVGQFAPLGATIKFPPFAKVLCAHPLVVPNWVGLEGDHSGSTLIFPTPTFSDTCLIRNDIQNGNGEYTRLRNLYVWGAKGTGAVCSDAVIQLVGAFINSDITDVIVNEGSNANLHLSAKGTPGGAGPLLVDNCWFANSGGHGVVIDEDATNTGAVNGIWMRHCAVENQGSNHSAVYLKGITGGRCAGWRLTNLHVEMGGVGAGGVALTIDGVSRVVVDTMQVLGNAGAGQSGIQITNHAQNVGLQIRSVTNTNVLPTILHSAIDNTSIGALNLDWWVSPDVTVLGGLQFRASAAAAAGRAFIVQDTGGTARVWVDGNGNLCGNGGVTGAGINVTAAVGAAIDRPLALLNASARDTGSGSFFTYEFPSGAGGAIQLKCNGNPAMQIGTDGSIFHYAANTFASSLACTAEVSAGIGAAPGDIGTGAAVALLLVPTTTSAPTGLAGPVAGRMMMVYNDSASFTITFANNAGTAAANGVIGKAGAAMVLAPKTGAWVYYSPSKSRWIEISL